MIAQKGAGAKTAPPLLSIKIKGAVMDAKNMYETDNLSLCPYLAMNGLKYVGIKKQNTSKKYIFIFEDDKFQGTDLAMGFLNSDERKYKNFWSYFRNELANASISARGERLEKNSKMSYGDQDLDLDRR